MPVDALLLKTEIIFKKVKTCFGLKSDNFKYDQTNGPHRAFPELLLPRFKFGQPSELFTCFATP